jgi:hypothetical protein
MFAGSVKIFTPKAHCEDLAATVQDHIDISIQMYPPW